MFAINGFWGLYAIVGFFSAVAAHVLVACGVPLPSATILGLVIAIFPVFIIAVLVHPESETHLGGASVPLDAIRNLPLWIHVVIATSLAYLYVLWMQIPEFRFSLMRQLDHDHQMIATWTPALFFSASYALVWSARRLRL